MKQGNIYYTDKDFTDLEVSTTFKYPCILILKNAENEIEKITAYNENGIKSIYDFSLSASKQFVTDSIATANVGSRSQQLSLSSVFIINQNGNANKIDVTAGQLYSQTLDKTWNVSALVSTIPDNDYRYVYAKASKTTSTASIYLSKNQIPFDSDVNDYYFLVGVLHSVVDGVRILSLTVGTTTISGGLIRTGIISSLDGLTSFNLNTGEIKGKITFSSGSSGYENLTDKPDLSSFEQTRDYVNSTLQTDLDDLKNRADGVIESWFYSHTPTLSNLPASNWVTTAERNAHIGDTFTNMQEFVDNVTTPDAGKAWRFVKNETTGEFSWSLIANSDSTKALIEAGKAKDTADAKRRVFVSQPYPPYNIGDLWVQGNGGDIMRCKFERLSGSYVATDFEKASKYTDDTAVNNLQIGGRNYYPDGDFTKGTNQYQGGNNVKSFSIIPTDFDGNPLPWNGSKVFSIYTETDGDTYAELSSIAKVDAGDYMLSFYYKAAGSINGNSSYLYINSIPYGLAFSITNNSQWHKVELPINISSKSDIQFRIGFNCSDPAWINVTRIKIEKGNKATDWTPAPEDVDSAISTAQNSANTANNLLADIANDNILTPSEKQSTKKEWDIIVGEKSFVENQANTLGVSTTSYVNAYNSLNSYITPLLADLTVNSAIVGVDFRATFKNYYDAKIALLKAVTDKLKSNTDNIQIGGRNLVRNSAQAVSNSTYLVASYNLSQPLNDGVYTIRIKGIFSTGDRPRPHIGGIGVEDYGDGTIQNGIYIKTFNYDTRFGNNTNLAIYRLVTDSNPMVIEWVKLEKGNKATDWTPAPEDIQLQIDSEAAKVINLENKTDFLTGTTIEGNAIATGTLLVGDGNGANAFISGITDDGGNSIRFAAGANYSDKQNANFKIFDNGKVIAKNADISGVVNATSGSFTGNIIASSGKFGDITSNKYFEIYSEGIKSKEGWIVSGDFQNFDGENNGKFYQLSGNQTDGGFIISIHNSKNDGLSHHCLKLNAKNGTTNVALQIDSGKIRIKNQLTGQFTYGFTGKANPKDDGQGGVKWSYYQDGLYIGETD